MAYNIKPPYKRTEEQKRKDRWPRERRCPHCGKELVIDTCLEQGDKSKDVRKSLFA